ncbi:hypothetical protein LN650_18720 [Klebsiella pneumoniae subsp. pneumoniae]|nr:hypothetical protein [Klebsiella pneumoniae subsp. pneumoniae]
MLESTQHPCAAADLEVTARHLSFTLPRMKYEPYPGSGQPSDPQAGDAHIGFRLFIRTTRKLALTEEGKRLLATLSHSLRGD